MLELAPRLPLWALGAPADMLGIVPGLMELIWPSTPGVGRVASAMSVAASMPGGSASLERAFERAGLLKPMSAEANVLALPVALLTGKLTPQTTFLQTPARTSRLVAAIERVAPEWEVIKDEAGNVVRDATGAVMRQDVKALPASQWIKVIREAPGGVASGEVAELFDVLASMGDRPMSRSLLLQSAQQRAANILPTRVRELRDPPAVTGKQRQLIEQADTRAYTGLKQLLVDSGAGNEQAQHFIDNFAFDLYRTSGDDVDRHVFDWTDHIASQLPKAVDKHELYDRLMRLRNTRNDYNKLLAYSEKPGATALARYGGSVSVPLTLPGGNNYRERLIEWTSANGFRAPMAYERKRGLPGAPVYESQHFPGSQNPIVHLRLIDRITQSPGGRPVRTLFVEELQSDWAQQGRKYGFVSEKPTNPAQQAKGVNIVDILNAEPSTRAKMLDDAMQAQRTYDMPNMPGWQKTEDWTALAIRDLIDVAAREGYDRIAFIDGKRTAQRYGKMVEDADVEYWVEKKPIMSLRHNAVDEMGVRVRSVLGEEPTLRWRFRDPRLEAQYGIKEIEGPQQLLDIFGREGAQHILATASETPQPLRMPAQSKGFETHYDMIVPKEAKKAAARVGGTVSRAPIMGLEGDFFGIDLNPTARARALQPGSQLLWGAAGAAAAQQALQQQRSDSALDLNNYGISRRPNAPATGPQP